MRGARIVEQTRVTGVLDATTAGSPVCAPTRATSRPRSSSTAPASGPRQVGAMAGVTVPLHSAEHFYVVTEHDRRRAPRPAGPARPRRLHLLQGGGRRPGRRRLRARGQAVGVARRDPVPVRVPAARGGLGPLRGPDGQRVLRIPALEETGIRSSTTARRASPPTTSSSSARRPSCANFFVGAGFNSVGIASAGGAGRALAEWIVDGEPTSDLTGVDIRRFAPFNGNNRWLHDRVAEVLGLHYAIPWPNREMTTARPFRRSPLHHLLEAANANFGSRMGWERANFFAPAGVDPAIEYTWGKPNWLPWSAAEQASTRTGVTVFDQTSFSKYLIVGPDAEAALQWLCTADVAVAGRHGRLHRDAQRARHLRVRRHRDPDRRRRVPARQQRRHHRARPGPHPPNLPAGARASLVDVTSAYAVFGVMGPRSRDLLATPDRRRPVRRRVPVRHQPADLAGLCDRAGHPDHLRRRAGLGALRARRVRGRRLRGPDGGRRPTSGSAAAATTRSSRCGWRRATAPSAAS